jgi:hypothetical protein
MIILLAFLTHSTRKWHRQQAIRRPRSRLTALDSPLSLDDEGSLYVPTDSEGGSEV